MASLPPRNDRTIRLRQIAQSLDVPNGVTPARAPMHTPWSDEERTNPAIIQVNTGNGTAEQAASFLTRPLLPLPIGYRFPALLALLVTLVALAYLWLNRPV